VLADTPEDVSVAEVVALEVGLEVAALAVGVEVALEVSLEAAVGVAVAVAVAGASGGDSGSGSPIEEVVSPMVVVWRGPSAVVEGYVRSVRVPGRVEVNSSMVVFGRLPSEVVLGRVPSTRVEGCVRSIRVSGRLLPSNNLSSHCTPVTKAAIKATSAASTNTACNSPKKYLAPEYGLKTTRSA
jgi:hypothetical protein